MKIFATGKNGTIGRGLSKDVLSLKLDLLQSPSTWDIGEIDHTSSVIHLAGVVGEGAVRKDLKHSKKINVDATKQLGQVLSEKGIRQLVYVSTAHIYGFSENDLDENSHLNPISHYAEQKLMAEKILLEIFEESPTKLVILRVFSLLDFGMKASTLGGAVEEILNQGNRKIENGDDIRDFLTPTQAAEIIEKISISNPRYSIYNVCSGESLTVRSAVQLMANGRKSHISQHVNSNHFPVTRIVGSNQRLRECFPNLNLTWKYSNKSTKAVK